MLEDGVVKGAIKKTFLVAEIVSDYRKKSDTINDERLLSILPYNL